MENQREVTRFPRFKGRFFTWRSTTFVDQENRSKENFLVYSSGKREAVFKHLWLKLVWDQLTRIEFELFVSMLGEKDVKIWSFLELLLNIPKILLRQNLLKAESIYGEEISTRERYIGSKRICIEIQREIRRLPKTKKFSGYIRSLASRGKSQLGEGRIELPSTNFPDFVEDVDLDKFWRSVLLYPSLVFTSEQEK
jgi:hypothetical protein